MPASTRVSAYGGAFAHVAIALASQLPATGALS
jgi:hypothetical protein